MLESSVALSFAASYITFANLLKPYWVSELMRPP